MTREQMLTRLHAHLAKVREENAIAPPKTLDDLAAADLELHARVEEIRAQIPAEPLREPTTEPRSTETEESK